MIKPAEYDLRSGNKGAGMRATDGPKRSLLSTFWNTSGGSEPQVTKKKQPEQALHQVNGAPTRADPSTDEEDELTSSQAPSVTSPRVARIRRPTPARDTNTSGEMEDPYYDIDDFSTPKQQRTKSPQTQESLRGEDTTLIALDMRKDKLENGDIVPTLWDAKKVETAKERDKETKRLLREKDKERVNPQHMRGAGFSTDSVRGQEKRLVLGSNWETGKIRKKQNSTYKSKAFGSRNRLSAQEKTVRSTSLISDYGDESGEESKITTSKATVTRPNNDFKDPTKLFPLPPKKLESQSGNDSDDYFPKSKPKKQQVETKSNTFINPFSRKYNLSPEPEEDESQTQSYIDESNDKINSIKGSEKGGSKKRKASKAIDLSISEGNRAGQYDTYSSPDDAELFAGESQSSSQAKKRKAKLETVDICVLCNTILPLGTLDGWRYDDGELKSIRMAEWTEICDKHKAADLQKEWEKEGYPVIQWRGLKKRVEKYHQLLVDIVEDKVVSPFREVFATQQKETRGNAAMLLRRDVQLQYPGYYGPRGSAILLHEITMRLGSFIGDAAKKDRLIGQGGVSAFIQTVLVPELGVRLIMEDMNVSEFVARKTLDTSREIGEKLHFDDFTEDIYDEADGPWFDINATQTPGAAKRK